MNRLTTFLCAVALVSLPQAADAVQVVVANYAPNAGEVAIVVVGRGPVAGPLAYRDIGSAEVVAGATVRAVRIATGEVLASLVITGPNSRTPHREALLLVGGGSGFPFQLHHSHEVTPNESGGLNVPRYWHVWHNAALYPGTDVEATAPLVSEECRSPGTDSNKVHRVPYVSRYDVIGRTSDTQLVNRTCIYRVIVAGQTLGLENFHHDPDATYRLIVIGDGSTAAPFEFVILKDAAVVGASGVVPLQPGAVIRSPSFWHDAVRPAQGVTLFEEPAARAVYGSWYTFDANGKPVWYLIDGVHAEAPGRRDVIIHSVKRTATGQQVTRIGTARLIYADCNEAEFRAVIGETIRTLSLRRTQPVERCAALE